MNDVPMIETARLRLRGHRVDDFDASVKMWADPDVTRYIGGKPSTPQQAWSRMLGYAGHWHFMGFGYWAIELKATGTYIGELGFADFKRDITPSFRETPELGWAIASPEHGNGYGSEAVRAAVSWGDAHLAAGTTVCIINPENAPSLRIAEKVGFRETRRMEYADRPIVLFGRERLPSL